MTVTSSRQMKSNIPVLASREKGRIDMSEVTYRRLDRVLRSLGFTCRTVTLEAPALVYRHKETGALLALPEFTAQLQKAS